MRCPSKVADLLLRILEVAALRIRAAGWAGDAAACADEADHVHNLPRLIAEFDPELLRCYLEAERASYVASPRSEPGDFEPLWRELERQITERALA